jgi:hypothetical protein
MAAIPDHAILVNLELFSQKNDNIVVKTVISSLNPRLS